MRVIKIDKNNQVNGDGLRCVVWFAGCKHKCHGCHNPETWDFNCGHDFNEDDQKNIVKQLESQEISGITLSGGDPIYQVDEITLWLKNIKENFPNKDVWCYTGFLFEKIKNLPIMQYIDVLIDGKYEAALNPGVGKVLWRGSINQRIIDVQQSLKTGKIVLLYE